MGLANGPHGVKTFVKDKFPNAFFDAESLERCRNMAGYTAEQTAVLLDGNVLINLVPSAVNDFNGYVTTFSRFVSQGLAAGRQVVIVFDEPLLVTKAKSAEQAKRDASRKKSMPEMSADLEDEFAPTNDCYGLEVIEKCNPHVLLKNRAARPRFYDALAVAVMKRVMYSDRPQPAGTTLTFDGIDSRGGDRRYDQDRETGMFSSDDRMEFLLSRKSGEATVGEGDLKFSDLQNEIQSLRADDRAFQNVELVIVSTIDTDSIAIELLNQGAKMEQAAAASDVDDEARPPMKTLLIFRETTGKRKGSDAAPTTSYACFDLEKLEDGLMRSLFGDTYDVRSQLRRNAMALLAAGWALCGSDFVELKGMRSDVVYDAVVEICQRKASLLTKMDHALELGRSSTDEQLDQAKTHMVDAIKTLVSIAGAKLGELPRMQRANASVRDVTHDTMAKAAWCVTYWTGFEMKDLARWGFDIPNASPTPPTPPSPPSPTPPEPILSSYFRKSGGTQ